MTTINNLKIELDDIELSLIMYKDLYLKEFTYYGSSKFDKMLILLNLVQELTILENNIINNFYNYYVQIILSDISNPNSYYLLSIIYGIFNIILQMVILISENKSNNEYDDYKLRYLIASIENFITKIIEPIESKLKSILELNKNFQLENSISYLKNFIEKHKIKFINKNKIKKLELFIELIE